MSSALRVVRDKRGVNTSSRGCRRTFSCDGAHRQATGEQGIAIGAICLVLGFLAVVLGICVGYLGI